MSVEVIYKNYKQEHYNESNEYEGVKIDELIIKDNKGKYVKYNSNNNKLYFVAE